MCLAVPGEIVGIDGNKAWVDFSGVRRQVDLRLVPGVKTGEYVLVHAGCAIQTVPRDEALETVRLFKEIMDGAEFDEDQ